MQTMYKKGNGHVFKFDFCDDEGLSVDIETVDDEVADEMLMEGWANSPWEAYGLNEKGEAVEQKRKRRTKAEMEAAQEE